MKPNIFNSLLFLAIFTIGTTYTTERLISLEVAVPLSELYERMRAHDSLHELSPACQHVVECIQQGKRTCDEAMLHEVFNELHKHHMLPASQLKASGYFEALGVHATPNHAQLNKLIPALPRPMQRTAEPKRYCNGESICNLLDEILAKIPCLDTYEISQDDIPCVIDKPGYYRLCGDINFDPQEVGQTAITIVSNDVELDLSGHTLRQVNEVLDVTGIQVGYGNTPNNEVLNNITIKNGSITHITGTAITVYNLAFKDDNSASFENLTFSDLSILYCGLADHRTQFISVGIAMVVPGLEVEPFGLEATAFRNVTVQNCKLNNNIGETTLTLYLASNVRIENSEVNNSRYYFPCHFLESFSIVLFRCADIMISNCQANGNLQLSEEPANCPSGPIVVSICSNVLVQNSQFNDAYGITSDVVCANLPNNENMVFENCQFNNHVTAGELNSQAAGVLCGAWVEQTTPARGQAFRNCQFNGTRGGTSPAGYRGLTLRDSTFDGCQALNIGDGQSIAALGFYVLETPRYHQPAISNVINLTFRNCTAASIAGSLESYGFIAATTANATSSGETSQLSNIVFDNCIAEHITGANDLAIGIGTLHLTGQYSESPMISNFFIRNCRISDVHVAGNPSVDSLSAGILMYGAKRPVICQNSISDCDRGILLSGSDELYPNNGFRVAATQEQALAGEFIPLEISNPLPACLFSPISPLVIGLGQSFDNTTSGGSTGDFLQLIAETYIDYLPYFPTNSMFFFDGSLTDLGWNTGDALVFHNNGCDDGFVPLVDGETYYAILYREIYSEDGVIKNNEIDNCTLTGYQDDRTPTSSLWLDNVAYNNTPNYAINWGITPPVDEGSVATGYPTNCEKWYNLSINQ